MGHFIEKADCFLMGPASQSTNINVVKISGIPLTKTMGMLYGWGVEESMLDKTSIPSQACLNYTFLAIITIE